METTMPLTWRVVMFRDPEDSDVVYQGLTFAAAHELMDTIHENGGSAMLEPENNRPSDPTAPDGSPDFPNDAETH
jgi:hypothetical protein